MGGTGRLPAEIQAEKETFEPEVPLDPSDQRWHLLPSISQAASCDVRGVESYS